MKIAFFSSEVFPFAKTGGLADVAGSLPLALGEMGHKVIIFMPLYKGIECQELNDAYGHSVLSENVEIYFIRHDLFFKREYLYNMPHADYSDNTLRFSFFCKEALDLLRLLNFKPDIYHCNDWQTALIPLLLKTKAKSLKFFKNAKSVFTIHNLAFQGWTDSRKFESLGVAKELEDVLEMGGTLNFLKGAILCSDAVNTVSSTYAKEICTHEFGSNLQYILQIISSKLSGIVNGIDYNVWNPATDENISHQYKKMTIELKSQNKNSLLAEYGLKKKRNSMLLGMVTRLSRQKGIDLFLRALPKILQKHCVIVLGTGEKEYHDGLAKLKKQFPERLAVIHDYNEALSHKIYASSDLFVMPSRFEPCGLSQLISFRYGTLPLVYSTGGLKDTVKNCDENGSKGNGFVFSDYNEDDLLAALKRAEKLFRSKEIWKSICKRAMGANYSWTRSAKKYDELYKRVAG